jgi:oxalate decarboxylase/phosphoglucose isomerase-like protein (cupin superfamily)
LEIPDLERFPRIKELQGVEATINEGDILYVPMYWWHHVINITDTVAINFWYKVSSSSTPAILHTFQLMSQAFEFKLAYFSAGRL